MDSPNFKITKPGATRMTAQLPSSVSAVDNDLCGQDQPFGGLGDTNQSRDPTVNKRSSPKQTLSTTNERLSRCRDRKRMSQSAFGERKGQHIRDIQYKMEKLEQRSNQFRKIHEIRRTGQPILRADDFTNLLNIDEAVEGDCEDPVATDVWMEHDSIRSNMPIYLEESRQEPWTGYTKMSASSTCQTSQDRIPQGFMGRSGMLCWPILQTSDDGCGIFDTGIP
ncbi:hypothetical protein B0J13DRAFT_639336 [Dactylonectria estremocensis]|uniref:BZIP domain-containing protein n=1 Tax=Dactylonectria estremocensis TaxID=1079267 RepID=A0A9P9J1P2_9HYPO|nr:hypothetical protein B0J13DRAFT_639336 [Dactylonectria estremocensis]